MVKRYRGERKRVGVATGTFIFQDLSGKKQISYILARLLQKATDEKCPKYEHRHRTGKRNTTKNAIGPSANTAIMATSFSSFFVWQEESLPIFAIKRWGGGGGCGNI
jgi:hypothetical protein